jgi:hypothetical protein
MPVLSNSKHESVAQAMIADPQRSAPAAYSRVYPKCTPAAARAGVSRLLKNAAFSARIAELEAEFAAKAVSEGIMGSQDVLRGLTSVARASLQNYLAAGGDTTDEVLAALKELEPEHAAAVREIEIETYVIGGGEDAQTVKSVKLKLHNKIPALVALGEHYGLFRRRIEASGPSGKPIEIKDAGELSPNEIARRIAFALIAAAPSTEKS